MNVPVAVVVAKIVGWFQERNRRRCARQFIDVWEREFGPFPSDERENVLARWPRWP